MKLGVMGFWTLGYKAYRLLDEHEHKWHGGTASSASCFCLVLSGFWVDFSSRNVVQLYSLVIPVPRRRDMSTESPSLSLFAFCT